MLHHYKARVYDPSLGRFLQTDPIGYEDDQNLYAYVYNDPLNKADPTGTCEAEIGTRICTVHQYAGQLAEQAWTAAGQMAAAVGSHLQVSAGARAQVEGGTQARNRATEMSTKGEAELGVYVDGKDGASVRLTGEVTTSLRGKAGEAASPVGWKGAMVLSGTGMRMSAVRPTAVLGSIQGNIGTRGNVKVGSGGDLSATATRGPFFFRAGVRDFSDLKERLSALKWYYFGDD